jgi:hypothetical protein
MMHDDRTGYPIPIPDGGTGLRLLGYGPSLADFPRRAAVFVDKIFKGAKPADLPVEQPTKFDLLVSDLCCTCSRPQLALGCPAGMSAFMESFGG